MPSSQNLKWRSAVLDGFAVLIAILLAFGIDAWWDLRNEDEEARSYLQALKTELIDNRATIDQDIQFLQSLVAESQSFLDDVVSPEASPTYEQVSEMVWTIGPDQTTPLLSAAVDASALASVRSDFRDFNLRYNIQNGSFTEFNW